MSETIKPDSLQISTVRYIKLGRGGVWAEESLSEGYLAFGYHSIPHEPCLNRDWDTVRSLLSDRKSEGAITAGVNEVASFYEQPKTCLWITFAQGHLWWGFAEQEVIWLGGHPEGSPSRIRPIVGSWSKYNAFGEPLVVSELSSKLTKVANFRGTICTIENEDYLLRKIAGTDEPLVVEGKSLQIRMAQLAEQLIRELHWADFETLVDLIFSRSGWQRSSKVGAGLADVDLILEQPTTGERAFVQVKSRSDQALLNDYLRRYRASGFDRFFYACHSVKGNLSLPSEPTLHLLSGTKLAEITIKCGLFDWLLERSN